MFCRQALLSFFSLWLSLGSIRLDWNKQALEQWVGLIDGEAGYLPRPARMLDQLLKSPGKPEKSIHNLPLKTRLKQAEGCCPPGSGNSLKRVSDLETKVDFTGSQRSKMVPPESSISAWEKGVCHSFHSLSTGKTLAGTIYRDKRQKRPG